MKKYKTDDLSVVRLYRRVTCEPNDNNTVGLQYEYIGSKVALTKELSGIVFGTNNKINTISGQTYYTCMAAGDGYEVVALSADSIFKNLQNKENAPRTMTFADIMEFEEELSNLESKENNKINIDIDGGSSSEMDEADW